MVKLYMHSYWPCNVNKFGVKVRRGCRRVRVSLAVRAGKDGKSWVKRHKTHNKNSLSLFNMINCEIVKIDGINKQANECEQKKDG